MVPLARFCREHGFELRFIEYMPIGAEAWERDKVFFAHEILELLDREVGAAGAGGRTTTRAPRRWTSTTPTAAGGSASSRRCRGRSAGSCNRLRLTADGKLRNCLFALDEADVKPLLRPAPDDAALAELIRAGGVGEVGGARDQHGRGS